MENTNMTQEQVYLQRVLEKFNKDPNDPELQDIEKILLGKIREVQKDISTLTQEIEKLNEEIEDRKQKGDEMVKQIVHKQGQSQGFLESLLAVRKE